MKYAELVERLSKAEEELSKAEKSYNQLLGKMESLKDNLKKLTGTSNENDAQKVISLWEREIDEAEEKMETLLSEIEETMEQSHAE